MTYNWTYHQKAKARRLQEAWDKVSEHVFAKLGVSNRVALAGVVHRSNE